MADAEPMKDKREAILAAAAELFDDRGYAATTMEAVAERAGIAKGSVYNYFQSKHDLFDQVFTRAISGDEALTEELIAEPISASAKLQRLLDLVHQRMGAYRRIGLLALEYWTAAAREQRHGGQEVRSFAEFYERWRDLIARILTQGVETGEFPDYIDPKTGATLFRALVDGLIVHVVLGVDIRIDDDFLARMKNAVLNALTSDTKPALPDQ